MAVHFSPSTLDFTPENAEESPYPLEGMHVKLGSGKPGLISLSAYSSSLLATTMIAL